MTKITRLVMHGFKSFAKRTELLFGDRYNCILGPNGSGKSNVLDALCFVLGRSSAKALRAEKSTNLIYNGGKAKTPAKFGEVSIWFDNTDKVFPTDDAEVKISRIVRSSGQSVYKINDETRTRQQILELLSLARINPEGYNIILQGDIVRFVEMATVERRQLVEEIAGISIYEEKKQKAMKELERVEERLKEADIVLAERETHLKELKKERDQAKRYSELNDKINSYKASYLFKQIEKKKEEKADWEAKVNKHKTKVAELSEKIAEFKKQIAEKKNRIDAINKEIESKGEKDQIIIHKEIEKLKVEIATTKNRIETLKAEIVKVTERKKQLKDNIKETEDKISELELKKKELDKLVVTNRNNLTEIDRKIEAFRKKNQLDNVEAIEKDVDKIDKHAEEKQHETNKLRVDQQELLRKKDKLELQIQAIDEKIEKVLSVEKENKEQIDALKKKKDEFKKFTVQLQELLNENSSLSAQMGDAKIKSARAEEELARLNAKTMTMQETLSADVATKKILGQKGKIKGIFGMVSELGEVSSKYSLALEVAAGNKIKGIVVENDKVAADCIQYLKDNKYGIATFYPLNRVKGRESSKELASLKSANGAYGDAIDLITFDKKFRPVFSHIFENTLVVENIEVARRIGIGAVKMVTLDGDIAEKSGAMQGGFRSRKSLGVGFAEKELKKNLADLEGDAADAKAVIARLEKKKSDNEDRIAKARNDKANLEGDIIKIEKSLNLDSGDIDVSKKIKKEIEEQVKEAEKEIRNVDMKLSQVNSEMAQNKIKRQELRNKISELRNPALIAELTAFDEKKKEINQKIIEYNSDAKNIDLQINTILRPDVENQMKIIKQHDKEEDSFGIELKKITESVKAAEIDLKDKEEKEQKFYKQFQGLFTERNKIDEEIKKIDSKVDERMAESKDVELKLNTINIDHARVSAELAGMEKEMEQYGTAPIIKNKSEAELKREIAEFEKFVNDIGSVNMKALEIYDHVEKEYNELHGKKERLKVEKEDVLVMMNEIESKKKVIFLKTFDVVHEHFKQIFSALSTKGEAQLVLEDEKDPFNGGLLIRVKIMGNRFMDIRSLSGGEKTMTALAFIFAIQEHEPASFYILDEVDAALDKRNAEKLAKLVRKYSDRAQYVMISHNDGVISEADQLYGVAMNEHGQSTVTTLKI